MNMYTLGSALTLSGMAGNVDPSSDDFPGALGTSFLDLLGMHVDTPVEVLVANPLTEIDEAIASWERVVEGGRNRAANMNERGLARLVEHVTFASNVETWCP